MFKASLLVFLTYFIMHVAYGQDKGIQFQHGLSWQELRDKAKAGNKYIFLDCYTTWCAPCKKMNKDIFPRPEVGEYMNKHFISAKIQMDKTGEDSDEIKKWYIDADSMKVRYQVKAYPTFLFFNPDGQLVYKMSTSFADPASFITSAQIAIEPNKEVSKLLKQYNDGIRDTSVLKYLALAARNEGNKKLALEVSADYATEVIRLMRKSRDLSIYKHIASVVWNAGNDSLASKYANKYIDGMSNVFTKENIAYIVRYTTTPEQRGFKLFVREAAKINKFMGQVSYNYAIDAAKNIILRHDENFVSIRSGSIAEPDWNSIQSNLSRKYTPLIADKTVGFSKRLFYKKQKQWPEYIATLIDFVSKYPESITLSGYNDYAWDIFAHSDDPVQLTIALEWSKKTLSANVKDIYVNMDTYANILYKLGKTDEAVTWEERALGLADSGSKAMYKLALDKMKKGEKTW